jgi:hypothetical protein
MKPYTLIPEGDCTRIVTRIGQIVVDTNMVSHLEHLGVPEIAQGRARLRKLGTPVTYDTLSHVIIDAPAGQRVHHKDNDPLNCRRENLILSIKRERTIPSEPVSDQDRLIVPSDNYVGVSYIRGREALGTPWQAVWKHARRNHFLGYYKTEEDAYAAHRRQVDAYKTPLKPLATLVAEQSDLKGAL